MPHVGFAFNLGDTPLKLTVYVHSHEKMCVYRSSQSKAHSNHPAQLQRLAGIITTKALSSLRERAGWSALLWLV